MVVCTMYVSNENIICISQKLVHNIVRVLYVFSYRGGVDNIVEKNFTVFSLIQMQ